MEKKKLGGTCLNRGCIPAKASYKNAEILSTLKRIDEFGINVNDYIINIEQIHKRKQKIIDELVDGISKLLKANNVQIVYGEAKFKDKNTILVITADNSECEVIGKNIVIATESTPTIPPIEGANLDGIYTSEDILSFEAIPNL
ncbi:FAD-dependent oxidoreductase [Clostridium sp. UBA1056]|uniref:FAD-dependent oxidoreductase n=1 Tax=unclassified Clostridium TaxID=2614128 RepID=UPI003217AA7A